MTNGSSEDAASKLDRLDRAGLLALIEQQAKTIDRQGAIIDAQTGVIANYQGGGPRSGAAPVAAAPSANGAGAVRREAATNRKITPIPGAGHTIVFDGGALGNPGKGYGSYLIADASGTVVAADKLTHGENMTNNVAEFLTLIVALEQLARFLGEKATRERIAVRGDSLLVINGVTGSWKIKHENLKPLRARIVSLLSGFGSVDIRWHDRSNSVKLLGH